MDQQPTEGYWPATQIFSIQQSAGTKFEEVPYTSASPRQHHSGDHHQQQRCPPWLPPSGMPQWIPEVSDTLYPLAAQPHTPSGGGSSSHSDSPRRNVPSPIGSPGLTPSEQDACGRFVCKYPECDAKPEGRIFTRKSDWRFVSSSAQNTLKLPQLTQNGQPSL